MLNKREEIKKSEEIRAGAEDRDEELRKNLADFYRGILSSGIDYDEVELIQKPRERMYILKNPLTEDIFEFKLSDAKLIPQGICRCISGREKNVSDFLFYLIGSDWFKLEDWEL